MSLMDLFSKYTPKITHSDPETEKGNYGNHMSYEAVTATDPAKPNGNPSNQGNHENFINEGKLECEDIREYIEERAAIMEFDGGMSQADAEKSTLSSIRIYYYKVKDKPDSELTVIMPNTDLEEAHRTLLLRYGDRLIMVAERNIDKELSTFRGNHP